MLSREKANILRFVLDELMPPILRENKYFMYMLCYIWFKGKHVKRFMSFKHSFYKLTEEEYASFYRDYDDRAASRKTSANKKSIEYIVAHLGDDQTNRILDVGCGKGYVLKQIYDRGYHDLLGIDLVPKSAYDEIRIEEGNVEHLPFADKSFEVVVCTHILEHVLDLPQAIRELKRVAKDTLIIIVPKQRYYKYTFDLHIHFFPQASYLLQYLHLSDEKIEIQNVGGDWAVTCKMN
jgi:ubiquinone/menaquinone biosynthesis C-methylase UbiE